MSFFLGISITLVGAPGVGLTTLIRQYLHRIPPTDKTTKTRYSRIENAGGNLTYVFPCQEKPRFLRISIPCSKGVLIVFDLTDRTSFALIDELMADITKYQKAELVKVLVGNKCDLTSRRVVTRHEAEERAAAHGMAYFEATATDHDSIRAPFAEAARLLFEARQDLLPIHRAASAGDVAAIEQICAESYDQIDLRDEEGCTAFQHAAKNGHVSVIEALVRLGSQAIDTPNHNGSTPVHIAANFAQVAAIETLVRLGSKVIDAPNNYGHTPMHLAVQCGHEGSPVEVIEALVRLGSRAIDTPDNHGGLPIHSAIVASGREDVVEALFQLGIKDLDAPKKSGATALHIAAYLGNVEVIEKLVRLGSKAIDTPDKFGRTPLAEAAANGHVHAIEALVRLGSKAIDTPDNKGRTPMHAAAKGKVRVIETLVRLGSKAIDTPDRHEIRTPMHFAASVPGGTNAIEALRFWGSRAIDTPDRHGKTPVHLAVQYRQIESIEALCRFGSRILDAPGDFFANHRFYPWAAETLTALGIPCNKYSSISVELTEDQVFEVRERVHFSRSLTNRLLCELC